MPSENQEGSTKAPQAYKTLSWVVTLYYSQGLPFSLVRQVSVVFFKDQGVSLKSLGLISLYGIPWTFKFLWGPFVDGISSKRRWVVAVQAILALIFGLISVLVWQNVKPLVVAGVFFLVAFTAATQDIAIDGFYLEALKKDEQAKFSGWYQASYRLALLTGSGLLVGLSGRLPWWEIFWCVSAFFGLMSLWHYARLPQPQKEMKEKNHVPFIEGFQTFIQMPGIGLAISFIILFKVGDALLFGMSTPFLLDSGLSKEQLGLISGIFGTVSAILASITGGWFISRFSLKKGLYIFGLIQNLAIPVYAVVALMKPTPWILGLAVIVEQISAGLGTAAYGNFVMRQTSPQYRATHYAIATGLMALTTTLAGAISGFGAQKYGYGVFFSLAFAASIPGLLLIPFVARRPECQ